MSDIRPFYRRRSLFGPLVVVAIGIVFLLRNFGVISYRSFGWWFARYWPLLLIFWGVVKFLEYLWARQRNEPYPGVGAGGVVFLVFLVIFGVAATGASRMDWGWVDVDPREDWTDLFGPRYDFTDSFAQALPTATQVKVLSARGDITVTPSPDNQAHVVVHKYTRGYSQSDADQFNNSTHAQFQQQGTVWLLDLTAGNFSEGRFDVAIQVPAKDSVSLQAMRGDIHVSEMQSDLDLEVDNGKITTDQIAGTILLRPHRNDVTVSNVKGNVTIDGDVEHSMVSDVTGSLTYSTGYSGDIQFSHITGTIHFRSSRTDLQFGKLDGDLHMDGDDLRASSIAGPFTLSTETKNVHLEDVTGSIHIDDRRGDIEVEAKAPLGNVDISTTGGEINISLPEKPGFQLNAESDSGEIQSDFSLSVNNQAKNATATGAVGAGGPTVKLKTNRGAIQIHKAG